MPPGAGGFSDSFLVQMIRDFFILLVAFMAIEFGFKLALSLYEFDREDQGKVRIAAEQLANDVRAIMLNSGGPVAARTVYPILERNHAELDLIIAIEPSEVTVESIEERFGFTPNGLPANWPDGRFREYTVSLEAEAFCIACHAKAAVGDMLGRVTVRSYPGSHLSGWWNDVQFSSVLALGKITLHTVVLFFLLKARLAPLLSLRNVLGRLSRAGFDLSERVPVRSRDEFGELAHDLNLFLDRLSYTAQRNSL